jgi:tryptophan synthase alpha chain
MKNRLVQKLKEARKEKRKLFCAYLTLGFPRLSVTEALIPALEQAGADIIELGFPFSDPLADGPTIQFTSAKAIEKGVKLKNAFELVRRLRRKGVKIPILFFSYLNPLMHYGMTRALRQMHQNGYDGFIVPDLPPEEGRMWEPWAKKLDLSLVYLIAPTTTRERMRMVAKRSNGFIYYVSLRGVTGARSLVPADLTKNIRVIKKITRKPVLVGFGVARGEQAKAIARVADGIIVGSALMDQMRNGKNPIRAVTSLVSRLIKATRS